MRVTAYENGRSDTCFDVSATELRRSALRDGPPRHEYQDIADRWAGARCTLDGEPARVQGRCLPLARIAPMPSDIFPGIDADSVEFDWPTVERIMQSGGAFQS